MRDRLQEIAPSTIDLRQGDERSPQIVSAAVPHAQHGEVEAKSVRRLGVEALGQVAGWDDEVVVCGRPAERPLPTALTPVLEDSGERRMDRDAARDLGLRTFEVQCAERLESAIVLAPAKTRGFAVAQSRERLYRVEHASIFEQPNVRDEDLDLFSREDRVRPKGGVLVDVLRKDPPGQDAGGERDQIVGDCCPKHAGRGRVHVTDAAGCKHILFSHR